MPYLEKSKNTDNFMEILLRDHARYLPIVEFLDHIVQNAAQLSWADCELIGLALGEQNHSGFCTGIRLGMIKALAGSKYQSDPHKLTPIFAFARKLDADSSAVTEADIESLRAAGWNDQTVEDVVGLVAGLKVYSMLANGLGFGALPNAVFAAMGAATVRSGGYAPLFRSLIERASAAPSAMEMKRAVACPT